MLIICKSCHSFHNWLKLQHEKLKDQQCDCGGSYKMLKCYPECKYKQYAACKIQGKCIKRLEAK